MTVTRCWLARQRRSSASSKVHRLADCCHPTWTAPPRRRRDRRITCCTLAPIRLNLYKFHVDWATPANSTFTVRPGSAVAAFSPLCGGGQCVARAWRLHARFAGRPPDASTGLSQFRYPRVTRGDSLGHGGTAAAAFAGTRYKTRAAHRPWRSRARTLPTLPIAGWEAWLWIRPATWPSGIASPAVRSIPLSPSRAELRRIR